MKDSTACGIGTEGQQLDWDSINWESAERQVTHLRRRIYRATCEQKWNKVRSLTKLMLRSRSNLLLSVQRVTQTNKGKGTPGIDGRVALTNKARMTLIRQMEQRQFWKAQPSRRIYIPKAGKPGQLRTLLSTQHRYSELAASRLPVAKKSSSPRRRDQPSSTKSRAEGTTWFCSEP